MKERKSVVLREWADRDVRQALAYYLGEQAFQTARDFVVALEKAFAHLERYPAAGSPRYAHELNIPGLRSWTLSRFPYVIFYVEQDAYIDVWRMLHAHRDVPAWIDILNP